MLRHCTSSCPASHTWCYATPCLLALPHIHDATLLYVFLHFLTYMMLRCCKSSCTSAHTWCYATVRFLALPHIHALLNGKIWTHARAWQWRWENSSHKNLSKLTAEVVKNTVRRKKESRWGFWHVQWKIRAHVLRKFNYERDAKPLWFMVWNEWWTVLTLETRVR